MSDPASPGMPDLSALMGQAKKMQERMNALQQELAARRFEGSAGGGMVTAVVSGQLRVLEIRVEDGVYESGDREMLQDLTAAAVNAALAHANATVQREVQALQSQLAIRIPGMPVPGGQE